MFTDGDQEPFGFFIYTSGRNGNNLEISLKTFVFPLLIWEKNFKQKSSSSRIEEASVADSSEVEHLWSGCSCNGRLRIFQILLK